MDRTKYRTVQVDIDTHDRLRKLATEANSTISGCLRALSHADTDTLHLCSGRMLKVNSDG